MKNIKRIFWLLLGCISMGIGAVGVVLPILPTFPFLLLALFGFAKSSAKMENWFRSTGLYRKHLEPLRRRNHDQKGKNHSYAVPDPVYGNWFLVYGQCACGTCHSGPCLAVPYDLFHQGNPYSRGRGGINGEERQRTDRIQKAEGAEMVGKMMVLYCKSKHGGKAFKERGLCPQCRELLDYAEWKIRKCPFMEEKTFCSNCRVHCYKKKCVSVFAR